MSAWIEEKKLQICHFQKQAPHPFMLLSPLSVKKKKEKVMPSWISTYGSITQIGDS